VGLELGVACRYGADSRIQVLAQAADAGAGDQSPANYRRASSALAPAVLNTVEQQINGEPLDRAAEESAQQPGWRGGSR
jgi:hypothetical protein